MKVLILGASGMLGFTLFNYLNTKKNITLFATVRNKSSNKILLNKIYKHIDVKNFSLLEVLLSLKLLRFRGFIKYFVKVHIQIFSPNFSSNLI